MTVLQAIQEIFRRCGMPTPSAIATGSGSAVGECERVLDEADLRIQGNGGQGWNYNRRRDVLIEPSLYSITNATWTNSTYGITQTGSFTGATVGQTVSMTGGTGVTAQDVEVLEVDPSGNWINVDTDINGASGDIASGVTGTAATNRIIIPTGCISIDTYGADEWRNFTQLGNYLYDLDNNTEQFDQGYKFEYVLRYNLGCIPHEIAEFIVSEAAVSFAAMMNTDGSRRQEIGRKWLSAKAAAKRANLRSLDTNILNTPEAYINRGFRNAQANWVSIP